MKNKSDNEHLIKIEIWIILVISLSLFVYCSKNATNIIGPNNSLNTHYVAIDIDDIFQPNWDSALNKVGTVKMNASDVQNLVKITHDLRLQFGSDFSFSIGFNSGYFDSSNTGDMELLKNANEFFWFDHLTRHQHILDDNMTAIQIENLFAEGVVFEKNHGLTPYAPRYMVTPLHQGIWPPYVPLYTAFNLYGIRYTSSQDITDRASYGDVEILPRHFTGLGSAEYLFSQVSHEKIAQYADSTAFSVIMKNQAVILYLHQANFAKDRPGEELLRDIAHDLSTQSKYRIVFLPAFEVVRIAHEDSLSAHKR